MSKMKVYQEKVETQQTNVDPAALNTEPHEGEQVKEIAKEVGQGSIGWAEGMADETPQDSIGWAEGMANEAPQDSKGWVEGY